MQENVAMITILVDKDCGCMVFLFGGYSIELGYYTQSRGLYMVHQYIVDWGHDVMEADTLFDDFFHQGHIIMKL